MKNLFRNFTMLLALASLVSIFSCKDENDEPVVVADFSYAVDAANPLNVFFTNKSTGFSELSWNFGDGSPLSNDENPIHEFAAGGEYTVTLTATDKNGKDTKASTQKITLVGGVVPGPFSADRLVGGAGKVKTGENTVFVGPGLGLKDWWQVPPAYWNGGSNAGEDWSCMKDDEFIFAAGASGPTEGSMEYKTNGSARNDAYMGDPVGCWTDAQIAASGNGAAFGSGVHSYKLIDASISPSGRHIIELTNGATGAAFLGFYKGYYGGENANASNPPNGGQTTNLYEVMSYDVVGGKEVLVVSVDISAAHDGSAAWTATLTR
jgi:PKD repeat protein